MEKVLILDFGAQYSQLIARRIRECSVYCEVKPCTISPDEIRAYGPIGIVFSGGPKSVYEKASPHIAPEIFEMGVPILGICYGCQLMAYTLGGTVAAATEATAREYGKTVTTFEKSDALFSSLPAESITWMSHGDYISQVPQGFSVTAKTDVCPTAAMSNPQKKLYGVQFHPEVSHTEHGMEILRSFLYEVCGARGDWTMKDYRETAIASIRSKVGSGKALLALSGGVDSSVAAALMAEAIGSQLTCVFVDHGLMRKDEGDEVEKAFSKWDINFIRVNAEERFLSKLAGRHGARTQAQDHRRGVHSRLRGGGQEDRPRRLSGAGHHLPRRDRIRARQFRRHQESPQRRRPAGLCGF
jgi:GMP synthase (glutamine-hydrolysing)